MNICSDLGWNKTAMLAANHQMHPSTSQLHIHKLQKAATMNNKVAQKNQKAGQCNQKGAKYLFKSHRSMMRRFSNGGALVKTTLQFTYFTMKYF